MFNDIKFIDIPRIRQSEFNISATKILGDIANKYTESWQSIPLKEEDYPDKIICNQCMGCGTFKLNGEIRDCHQDREHGLCYYKFHDIKGFIDDIETRIESISNLLENQIVPDVDTEVERNMLIQLCKDSVVHHTKWKNPSSYTAQKGIQSIYKGLTAGLDFRIVTKNMDPQYYSSDMFLVIEFLQPIDFEKLSKGCDLTISSIDDYLGCYQSCETPDDIHGIDFHSHFTTKFMPSRKNLDKVGIGNDW